MGEIAIDARGLGKRYRIGGTREPYTTLRDTIVRGLKRPLERLRNPAARKGSEETFWALKDVSFRVNHGEAVGVIGRNGAGKSTLLKLLSRITEPTTGHADLHGRVSALLEVGTGFHPELTGRENIFLNGAVLGMKRSEITRKFDEIVAFAEIDQFLDTPVKRYSSGMYVRLAFGVAAYLEPDILVVDEVLAVGDAEFQRKCLGKMQSVADEGRTVLFVSHNMGAVQGMCQRAIWLDKGGLKADGPAGEVVREYLDSGHKGGALYTPERHLGYEDLIIEAMLIKNTRGEITSTIPSGEDFTVEVHYEALKRLPRPYFWLAVRSRFGSLFGANMLLDGIRPDFIEGRGVIGCTFSGIRMLPQAYTIRLGVREQNAVTNLTWTNPEVGFSITGDSRELGLRGEIAHNFYEDFYPLLVPYKWHLPDGRTISLNESDSNDRRWKNRDA